MADEPAGGGGGAKGKISNPVTDLILGFVTCSIYQVIWMYTRTKEINAYLGTQAVNPLFIFPGCFCLPILIYSAYLLAKALPDVQKKAGVEAKDEVMVHFILLGFLGPIGMWMIQQKLNDVWSK